MGGSRERGVVAAASYEARKFGVFSAMPSVIASRRCPDLIFVRPRFEVYQAVSKQIRKIFHKYTPLVEPLSLDEAYLDVTEPLIGPPSATLIAEMIRNEIFEVTGLTASAGISYCKFLAKVASDINKPNGMYIIQPDAAVSFLERLPIKKFHGIGKVTAEKMKEMGISTGFDLKNYTQKQLVRKFGRAGAHFYRIVRGDDQRPVIPDRVRKSIGAENTFNSDLSHHDELLDQLYKICETVWKRALHSNASGKTITLKVKFHDFKQISRSKSLDHYVKSEKELREQVLKLFFGAEEDYEPIRLMGVSISNLNIPDERFNKQLQIPFKHRFHHK
ncbi:DNA polymerase IV (plasmid) [Persicobacter psychrovividus]|uniref:DNA polymerase IV n=1 Tax=Persicobacter psychrovividus TaxID=387638 RepID=A0ABM7VKI7_9BACT|nr:DNA polymerase IV [Persicobacter psychrovividus]